jgi:hypothetical protein
MSCKDVAQIDQHGLALLGRAQEFDPVEFAHQVIEECLHLVLRGALGAFGHRERQGTFSRELEPFIADQEHRLRQVEGGKAGIDRKGNDAVGARHLLVLQPVALAAEEDANGAAGCGLPCHLLRGDFGRHHGLGLIVGAGGGGEQQATVGDRLLDRIVEFHMIQNMVGTGGGTLRADIGPAVARIDDPQPRQRKIAHRARRHADVLAELRLDQNHNGAGQRKA